MQYRAHQTHSSTMAPAKPITVKLIVDTSANKLVCAESGEDFVDVLFSFLTLPLATIVRLLDKKSSTGCMDNLYTSVETIESQYLTNEVCRTMFFRPRNSSTDECKRLSVTLDDTEAVKYYMCPTCNQRTYKLLSTYPSLRCSCGKEMGKVAELIGESAATVVDDSSGVFVKSDRFSIADDLVVAPVRDSLAMLSGLSIKDWSTLEDRVVKIGQDEVLQLLKRSLISQTPLTDVFIGKQEMVPLDLKSRPNMIYSPQIEDQDAGDSGEKITLKLVLSNRKLLYAEAKIDFIDLLFSFLALPVGCVEKQLGGCGFSGCLDNLYRSVEIMSSIGGIKEEVKDKLLNPKLPYDFSCITKLINIPKQPDQKQWYGCNSSSTCSYISSRSTAYCSKCTYYSGRWLPCAIDVAISVVDPKTLWKVGSWSYMVTDDLSVTRLSIVSTVLICKGVNGNVQEMEISVGKDEALKLLRASMTSKTAITDAFLSVKREKGREITDAFLSVKREK